ncbi:hypothetical protein T4E_2235 [Trichinella pseudospiralis]|uniref:Uncharacterized protein n=1 Tax=Trichinella pseudospiralis TaxID=6337 RepID=A0A0V0XST6_TRIPS|nr:hypothetical protein T4E_2235 [Trichinella pseudospiralis]
MSSSDGKLNLFIKLTSHLREPNENTPQQARTMTNLESTAAITAPSKIAVVHSALLAMDGPRKSRMDAVNPMLEEYYKKKDDIEMLIMLLIDFVEKTKIFANKIKDVTIACNRFVVSGVKITEMLEKLDEFKEFNATLKHTCMPTLIKMNSELSIIHSNICRFSDENSEINKQQLAEISMIMGYTHRKSFDNVFCKVKKIEQRIKKIQMQIQRDPLRMMTHERSYSDAVKELSRELCFLQNRIQMNEYLIKQNLSNAFNMSESSFKEVQKTTIIHLLMAMLMSGQISQTIVKTRSS